MNDNIPPTQAESVESLRAKAISRADAGDVSGAFKIIKPKRKRAYHRALKRGEHWAVWQKVTIDQCNAISRVLYETRQEQYKMAGIYEVLYSGNEYKKENK